MKDKSLVLFSSDKMFFSIMVASSTGIAISEISIRHNNSEKNLNRISLSYFSLYFIICSIPSSVSNLKEFLLFSGRITQPG